jgi:hypothetical protein
MAFDATIIHWRSLAEFADALATITRPKYCKGITHHNTYQPDDLDWRGMDSMRAMRDYYRDTKQWPSGPNLFLCAKAPNPADTGIWQMTPITRPGTHAGVCNRDRLGIESVADWEARKPTTEQYTLLLLVTRLIMRHWGLPPTSINVHNECMTGRTCPGRYVTGTQIRADLMLATPRPPSPVAILYTLLSPCIPLTARAPDSPLADAPPLAAGAIVQGEPVAVNGWLHISDDATKPPGIGFVPRSYVRRV